MSGIDDIIVNTLDKDFAQANNAFNDLMADKVRERLDAQQAMVAQQMAGVVSPEADFDHDNYEVTNDELEFSPEEGDGE